jgi:hypothetical protein
MKITREELLVAVCIIVLLVWSSGAFGYVWQWISSHL